MSVSKVAGAAALAIEQEEQAALKKRAARQAAVNTVSQAEPDIVTARVTKRGDGKISMGIHVAAVGDAFYEKGETFAGERARMMELEDLGYVEIDEAAEK